MSTIRFDIAGMHQLQRQLAEADKNKNDFYRDALKELAARLLRKVIQRTPVGRKPTDLDEKATRYWEGYSGGTLRRGWTAKSESEAKSGKNTDLDTFINNVNVEYVGNIYAVTIINSVHYASAVEFGHRQEPGRFVPALGKRLKANFVRGRYMLTISEKELESQAPAILEKKLEAFIRSAVNGK